MKKISIRRGDEGLRSLLSRFIADKNLRKTSIWIALWFLSAGAASIISPLKIREMFAPYPLKDQLYAAGSDYVSLKSIVYSTTHATTNTFAYYLLFFTPVVLAALYIYILVKEKYSNRLAIASVSLLMTQTYILLAAKSLDFAVLSVLVLPSILLLVSWLHPKHSSRTFICLGLTLSALLSVPFFWIIILGAIVFARKRIITLYKNISRTQRLGITIPLILAAILQTIHSIKVKDYTWLTGTYNSATFSFTTPLNTLKQIAVDVDPDTLYDFPLVIGGLLVFAALSGYVYYQGFHALQAKVLCALSLLAFIVCTLNISNGLYMILTAVVIMAINGMAFLLHQWFTVFPKNPIARGLGVMLLFGFTALCCALQLYVFHDITRL